MSEKLFFDFHPYKLTILSKNEDKIVVLEHEQKIDSKQPFHQDELIDAIRPLSNRDSIPTFSWFSSEFTLIPNALFLPSELGNYYRLNFGELNPNVSLSYDAIYEGNLSLVYTIPKWLGDFKRSYFFSSKIIHHASCLIKNSLKSNYSDLISIIYEGTSFIMCVKKNNKLLICNSFEYQNEEDLIYFILSHHKQLELSENNTINFMSYIEELNSEKILGIVSHFKELSSYSIHFLNESDYNTTLTCE